MGRGSRAISSMDGDMAAARLARPFVSVMASLPAELLDADARLHALHAAVRFSRHLNPVNAADARAAFLAGAEAPPFAYAPADWADDAIDTLDGLRVPLEHPLGVEVAAAAAETRALVVALRERTAEAFDALTATCGWLAEVPEVPGDVPKGASPGAQVPAEAVLAAFRAALRARGMGDWEVTWDEVMASRVLVDAARRQVRVNPAARFREPDLVGLVVHEVDVHALRAANGARQPLALFSTGLAGSLPTEEGLALVAEERAGALPEGAIARQVHMVDTIRAARGVGFRELYEGVRERLGPASAWGMALRCKRGLARPDLPGAYAKDAVYLTGYRRVRAWLDAGGDAATLWAGKVGIHHPVADWVAAGWIVPAAQVPEAFATPR